MEFGTASTGGTDDKTGEKEEEEETQTAEATEAR